jgi:hypothetical protein
MEACLQSLSGFKSDVEWGQSNLEKLYLFGVTQSPDAIEFEWPRPEELQSIGFKKGVKIS